MFFFDVNVSLGRGFDSVERLLAELRRLRIAGALVHHEAARDDMGRGNRLLLEAIEHHPSLYACWLLDFSHLDGVAGVRPFVREAVAADVRALRATLRPAEVTAWGGYLETLLDELAKADLPLVVEFLEPPEAAPLAALASIVERHPSVRVVLVGAPEALPLLARHDNLFLEYHDFPLPEGPLPLEKLLFGSGMPGAAGEAPVEATLLSGLRPSEQQALAAGNAYRVFSIPDRTAIPSLYLEPVRRPPGLVIDISAPLDIRHHLYGAEEDLTSTQRPGVHKAVLAGTPRSGADLERFAGRLYTYITPGPDAPPRVAAGRSMIVALRLRDPSSDSEGAREAVVLARRDALPILLPEWGSDDGMSGDDLARWAEAAAREREAAFIVPGIDRWEGVDPEGRRLAEAARDVPNLYLSISGRPPRFGGLVELVRMAGARKILFGTGFSPHCTAGDLARRLGYITLSPLPYIDKLNILGANALRLFPRLG